MLGDQFATDARRRDAYWLVLEYGAQEDIVPCASRREAVERMQMMRGRVPNGYIIAGRIIKRWTRPKLAAALRAERRSRKATTEGSR